MAKFLMELSLTDYPSLKFVPSQLAAAALYIACKICGDGEWVCQHCSVHVHVHVCGFLIKCLLYKIVLIIS